MAYQQNIENLLLTLFIKSSQVFEDSDDDEDILVIWNLVFIMLLNLKHGAIFLRRVGSKNEIFGICSRYDILEGTVYLCCKRVMIAILSLKNELVKWPTGELKRMVHLGFNNIGGFNNVIGAIDGTYIILGTASLKQPEIYWNRKKKYSIQCQGIVDHRGVFINYEIGWPGSVHDAKVYRNSFFYQNVSTLIKGWDYLLGDSAYPLSTFHIKPFNNPVNNLETQFNITHSSHCVVVENAFEINNDSWDELDENDDSNSDSDNKSNSEENNNICNLNENSLKRAGELKRNQIITQLF
ncbi:putative nuclease HARBI1 [Rhizophagus clarus]|uniref:Putative nuclease HARBI1 n=1 Tax=Rhizophagus clarus TaxID=94130 RepID=A0A8H3LWS7_9GLOM|nr:putative nuclease HARBI1 [Rhizophagus clarus]